MKTAIIATVITIVIIALCGVATAEVYPTTAKVMAQYSAWELIH